MRLPNTIEAPKCKGVIHLPGNHGSVTATQLHLTLTGYVLPKKVLQICLLNLLSSSLPIYQYHQASFCKSRLLESSESAS